ncbi:hypothetical protein ACFSZS_03315 [Seohaeicola zhoushanensis]
MTAPEIISFLAGGALLVMSVFVMFAYRPGGDRVDSGPSLLALAIWIGFFAAAVNTAYWQIFGTISVAAGWLTPEQLRAGGKYADLLFKGGGAFAGWLHLKAMHQSSIPRTGPTGPSSRCPSTPGADCACAPSRVS